VSLTLKNRLRITQAEDFKKGLEPGIPAASSPFAAPWRSPLQSVAQPVEQDLVNFDDQEFLTFAFSWIE
jgi:hypothetical protein